MSEARARMKEIIQGYVAALELEYKGMERELADILEGERARLMEAYHRRQLIRDRWKAGNFLDRRKATLLQKQCAITAI